MKIFLDAWYPGSWAQLQLQPVQSADVENGENTGNDQESE